MTRSRTDAILIREAQVEDSPDIIRIIGACFARYPGCVLDLPGLDSDLPDAAGHFRKAGGVLWIAERLSEVVGCGGYVPCADDPGSIELKRLYVAPHAWRHGIASRLLDRILAKARHLCAKRIILWSDTRFHEAHAFYKRHGFLASGETRRLGDPSDTTEYHFERPL